MNPLFDKLSLPGLTSAAKLSETVPHQAQTTREDCWREAEQVPAETSAPSRIEVIALLRRVFRMEAKAAFEARLLGSTTL